MGATPAAPVLSMAHTWTVPTLLAAQGWFSCPCCRLRPLGPGQGLLTYPSFLCPVQALEDQGSPPGPEPGLGTLRSLKDYRLISPPQAGEQGLGSLSLTPQTPVTPGGQVVPCLPHGHTDISAS